MADPVLSKNDRQESLSRAYIQAVAGAAGFTIAVPEFDRDSVDLTIASGGHMRPRLDVQLKATTSLSRVGSEFRFPLPIKNYDDLRVPTQTPRILVVLDMPKDEMEWVTISIEQLILRKAAYWVSLAGKTEVENETALTVSIPDSNVFDVAAVTELMDRSRRGKI